MQKKLSRYRRVQRFFSSFKIDYDRVAGFIFELFFVPNGPLYLTMDRTNWQWGKCDINILTLGIVFKGMAIPIFWMLLDKKGNSDTPERITLIQLFTRRFGKDCIAGILADREFIGTDWFGWLLSEKIPYLAALGMPDGELLIVATSEPPGNAMEIYALRWEIETLFGCLKGRGFNFEDTHEAFTYPP